MRALIHVQSPWPNQLLWDFPFASSGSDVGGYGWALKSQNGLGWEGPEGSDFGESLKVATT